MISELKIDKSKWQKVRFDDVAFEPKETITDIASSGIEHVVGLEHIESESIHLKRSNGIEESTTFTKKFSAGDVLFGRRRAYLKKAAVAKFDGICSGDITVFRAKPNLLPELLPFIVYNDKFFDYAVKHSAGGLSPRVKFKDLANYEFLLPPKDQQSQIAELLWAIDDVIEKDIALLEKMQSYKNSYIKELFLGKRRLYKNKNEFKNTTVGFIPIEWNVKKIEEICDVIRGASPRPKGDPRYYGGSVPRLMGEDVTRDGKYVIPKIDFLTEEGAKLSRPLPKGSLVMICSGNVGLTSILAVDCCIHDGFLAFINISSECNVDFLYYTFNSQLNRIDKYATHGGIFTNLTTDIMKNFEIALPNKEEQDFIGKEISKQDELLKVIYNKISASKSLQKSLINQVF